MVVRTLIDQWKARREGDAIRLAEALLDHPALEPLKSGILDARGRVDRRVQLALGLLGLPSHADYEKVLSVLNRSGRKLTALELNLARVEGLLDGSAPVIELVKPVASPKPAAKPVAARPAAKPKRKPAARPARLAKKPVAVPVAAVPRAASRPTALSDVRSAPRYKARPAAAKSVAPQVRSAAATVADRGPREALLSPVELGKSRISEVAVRPAKGNGGLPSSSQMLAGFGPAPKQTAR